MSSGVGQTTSSAVFQIHQDRKHSTVSERDRLMRLGLPIRDPLATNAAPSGVAVSPEILTRDYGNKHARLIQLSEIADRLRPLNAVVPLPFGVSSECIGSFLLQEAPCIVTLWSALDTSFTAWRGAGKSAALFLEERVTRDTLTRIQEAIIGAFRAASTGSTLWQSLREAETLSKWLHEVQQQGAFLMVRSTGQEDGRVANAGGNKSVSYVVPQPDVVLQAVGEVIASYFSCPSIKNLLLGDVNPFATPPNFAVTLQELIGEPVGGAAASHDVPVSCVLFSNEPSYTGGSLGSDQFRALCISASFGHGEGVVENLDIITDTALVLASRRTAGDTYEVYHNPEKPQRLAPVVNAITNTVSLQPVDNPQELSRRRAISSDVVRRLYELGILLEEFFGFPVDAELIIKNDRIYIVQARPINRQALTPTYISPELVNRQLRAVTNTLHTAVVVPAQTAALIIRNSTQLLMTNTLREAEIVYQAAQHRLILISRPEPVNSHPVVNFASRGVPVLYHSHMGKMRTLAEQTGRNEQALAICMQEGTITPWSEAATPADSLIRSGFVAHPAPIRLSLAIQPPRLPAGRVQFFIPADLSALLMQIRTAPTSEVALAALRQLAFHPIVRETAYEAERLGRRLAACETKKGRPRTTAMAQKTLQIATALSAALQNAFQEVAATFSAARITRLELLLKTKILATLIGTTTDETASVVSLIRMRDYFKCAHDTLAYQAQLPHPAILANESLFGSYCFGERQKDAWIAFLLDVERRAPRAKIVEFRRMLSQLDEQEVLPYWMNFIFAQARHHIANNRNLLDNLLGSYTARAEHALTAMQAKRRELQAFKRHLIDFSTLETLRTNLPKLKTLFEQVAIGFFTQTSSPLEQFAASQLMSEMVDLYDSAVKMMKASRLIEVAVKGAFFKELTGYYLLMLRYWAIQLLPPDAFPFLARERESIGRYIQTVEGILDRCETEEAQLLPSKEFTVGAATLGSGAAFSRHHPSTIEDVFSLTHQGLCACISYVISRLLAEGALNCLALPREIISCIGIIENFAVEGRCDIVWSAAAAGRGQFERMHDKPQKIGMTVTASQLTLLYNVPLRSHSAHLCLTYDKTSDKAELRLQLIGPAKDDARWDEVANYVNGLHLLGQIELLEPSQAEGDVVEMALRLPSDERGQGALFEKLQRILAGTLIHSWGERTINLPRFTPRHLAALIPQLFAKPAEWEAQTPYIAGALTLAPSYLPPIDLMFRLTTSSDTLIRRAAVNMLKKFLEQSGTASHPQMMETIHRLAVDRNVEVRKAIANPILPALLKVEAVQDALAPIIQRVAHDTSSAVRSSAALYVLDALLKQRQVSDLAIALAREAAIDPEPRIRTVFSHFTLSNFLNRPERLGEFIDILAVMARDEYATIRFKIISTIGVLLELGENRAIDEALPDSLALTIERLAGDENKDIREHVVKHILPILMQKGQRRFVQKILLSRACEQDEAINTAIRSQFAPWLQDREQALAAAQEVIATLICRVAK